MVSQAQSSLGFQTSRYHRSAGCPAAEASTVLGEQDNVGGGGALRKVVDGQKELGLHDRILATRTVEPADAVFRPGAKGFESAVREVRGLGLDFEALEVRGPGHRAVQGNRPAESLLREAEA